MTGDWLSDSLAPDCDAQHPQSDSLLAQYSLIVCLHRNCTLAFVGASKKCSPIAISTILLFLTGFLVHSFLAIDLSIFEKSKGDVYVQRCCGGSAALAATNQCVLINGLIEFPDIRSLRQDRFFSSSC